MTWLKKAQAMSPEAWLMLAETAIRDPYIRGYVISVVWWDFFANQPYKSDRVCPLREASNSFSETLKDHHYKMITEEQLTEGLIAIGFPRVRAMARAKTPRDIVERGREAAGAFRTGVRT